MGQVWGRYKADLLDMGYGWGMERVKPKPVPVPIPIPIFLYLPHTRFLPFLTPIWVISGADLTGFKWVRNYGIFCQP